MINCSLMMASPSPSSPSVPEMRDAHVITRGIQEVLVTSVTRSKMSIKINFRTLLQYPVLQLKPDTSISWQKLNKPEPRPLNAGDGPQPHALCANRVPFRVHNRIPRPGPNRVPWPGPNRVPRPGPNRVPQPG